MPRAFAGTCLSTVKSLRFMGSFLHLHFNCTFHTVVILPNLGSRMLVRGVIRMFEKNSLHF